MQRIPTTHLLLFIACIVLVIGLCMLCYYAGMRIGEMKEKVRADKKLLDFFSINKN